MNRKDQTRDGTQGVGVTLEGHARELIHHVDRVLRRLLAADRPKAEEAFSRQEIGVVDTLGAEGPMTMGELAGRLRLPLSTGTRVVDGLVARDLVGRERPEENRRVVRVVLTAKGRAFYRSALASRIVGARAMLRALTLEERRELIRLFRKIAASVTGEPAS
jgi:DNA-binding MarR family transcriptional regulator